MFPSFDVKNHWKKFSFLIIFFCVITHEVALYAVDIELENVSLIS